MGYSECYVFLQYECEKKNQTPPKHKTQNITNPGVRFLSSLTQQALSENDRNLTLVCLRFSRLELLVVLDSINIYLLFWAFNSAYNLFLILVE